MKNWKRIVTGVMLVVILAMTIVGCSIEGGVKFPSPMSDEQKLAAHNAGDHRYCEIIDIDYNDVCAHGTHKCTSITCLVGGYYATHYYYD